MRMAGTHKGDSMCVFVATEANNKVRWTDIFFFDAKNQEMEFSDENLLKKTTLYKKMEASGHRFICRGQWCAYEETNYPKLLLDGRVNLKGTYDQI